MGQAADSAVPVVESEAHGKPIETVEQGRAATPEPLPPIPPAPEEKVIPRWPTLARDHGSPSRQVVACCLDRARQSHPMKRSDQR